MSKVMSGAKNCLLSSLNETLPDERPLLSLQIVESVAKCPAGYWAVSRTYDEDADAGLFRQTGLFGKKPSHYICLSKSEGLPGYVMDGVVVVGEREAPPAGYGVAGRAGKRRLCTRVSRRAAPAAAAAPPVTDVIVCSRMRQAPQGFVLAGEMNGKVVCYKVGGGSADGSPAHENNYENVVSNHTPDAARRLRAAPERPPKLSPLVSELNHLNLASSPTAYPSIDEFATSHDYEALSPSYNIKPSRPAPQPPGGARGAGPARPPAGPVSPPAAARHRKGPAPLPRAAGYSTATLAGHCGMEGVPFALNPKLRGLPSDAMKQLPVIKRRTQFELDRDYAYNFAAERQA